MNKVQYIKACEIKSIIDRLKYKISDLEHYENVSGIPDEMFERHKSEIESYLIGEIEKLEDEFSKL